MFWKLRLEMMRWLLVGVFLNAAHGWMDILVKRIQLVPKWRNAIYKGFVLKIDNNLLWLADDLLSMKGLWQYRRQRLWEWEVNTWDCRTFPQFACANQLPCTHIAVATQHGGLEEAGMKSRTQPIYCLSCGSSRLSLCTAYLIRRTHCSSLYI